MSTETLISRLDGCGVKSLPPYGKDYLDGLPGSHSLEVVIGTNGWGFAKRRHKITLVLPYDEDPQNYRWPAHEYGALVYERGQYCDDRLSAMAKTLLEAGNPFVVAIREGLARPMRPDVYFYPEVKYVAA